MARKDLQWEFSSDPITEGDIQAVGEKLGVIFPKDYVQTAKKHHGGYPEPNRFMVEGVERVLGVLYSFDPEHEDGDLLTNNEDYRDEHGIPKQVVIFGEDPAGNFPCFDFRKDPKQPSIIFWNHEREGGDPKVVTHTFEDFLLMLH